MKKLLSLIFASAAFHACAATSIYLEPLYTVAVAQGHFESNHMILETENLTPIVYQDRLLPAGKTLRIECGIKQSKLIQVDTYVTEIPIQLWNSNNQNIGCSGKNLSVLWSSDEFKLKSESVVQFDPQKGFTPLAYNATLSKKIRGNIASISTNGELTKIQVNHAPDFAKVQFYGTLQHQRYLLQYTQQNNFYLLHVANLEKLLITDAAGNIMVTVDFPSYE